MLYDYIWSYDHWPIILHKLLVVNVSWFLLFSYLFLGVHPSVTQVTLRSFTRITLRWGLHQGKWHNKDHLYDHHTKSYNDNFHDCHCMVFKRCVAICRILRGTGQVYHWIWREMHCNSTTGISSESRVLRRKHVICLDHWWTSGEFIRSRTCVPGITNFRKWLLESLHWGAHVWWWLGFDSSGELPIQPFSTSRLRYRRTWGTL